MLRLEAFELVQEPIELVVGNFGIVEDVVPLLVMPNQLTELVQAFNRIGGRHRCDASLACGLSGTSAAGRCCVREM